MANNTNTNQGQNQDRVFYARCNIMKRAKGAPLEDAVFAVSGEVTFAEKKTGQYGDYVAITMTATLPDKSVERHFGADLVSPDHKVTFQFLLSGFQGENFCKYPPRWGQDIVFLLHSMKVLTFTRKTGETGHAISAKCAGYAAFGSLKKADGTDRPPIQIRGGAPAAPQQQKPETSVQDVMSSLGVDFDPEDDGELPF